MLLRRNWLPHILRPWKGNYFKRYFPNIQSLTSRLVRVPSQLQWHAFLMTMVMVKLSCWHFRRIQELRWSLKLSVFWSSVAVSYPNLCDLAFRHLLPFSSTYSCEAAFSQLLHIKTKYRNRLEVKHDLRCALSETKPRIKKLVDNLQHHPSHWVEWGFKSEENMNLAWTFRSKWSGSGRRWLCGHWRPCLWQLLMTPYDSISFKNYKVIRFVRFKDQITLRGINALFQSCGISLFVSFVFAYCWNSFSQ